MVQKFIFDSLFGRKGEKWPKLIFPLKQLFRVIFSADSEKNVKSFCVKSKKSKNCIFDFGSGSEKEGSDKKTKMFFPYLESA